MTRRAFAGRRELTPPPTRLDQRSNLSPCLPHGPYAFLAKMNQFHVVPATRPCRRAEKTGTGRMSIGRAFATKSPANAGLFNFRDVIFLNIANRRSVVNTAFVKMASI
jgi:hypothetical protein